MSIRVEYTDDNLGVNFYQEGVVAKEELYNTLSEVFSDEKYPRLKYFISDRTRLERFLLDDSDLEKIAELSNKESERNPGMLLAFVSPSDFSFGMLRRYESTHIYKTKFKTRVFRDKKSAEQWINEIIYSKK
jgi:hypothetical protein